MNQAMQKDGPTVSFTFQPTGLTKRTLGAIYYYHLPFSAEVLDEDGAECGGGWFEWGDFCISMLAAPEAMKGKHAPLEGVYISPWETDRSDSFTHLLVVEFDGAFDAQQLAPQFNDLERLTYTSRKDGKEVFQILLPLARPISATDFHRLVPVMQKYFDSAESQPKSLKSTYEVGRKFPWPDAESIVEYHPHGYVLSKDHFEEFAVEGRMRL